MSYDLPPIVKCAERLLLEVEQAVRAFSRFHKYQVGADLRAQAATVLRQCHRAWRDRPRQAHWTNELIWSIDELKLSIQLGKQLRAFRSFNQFEQLIRTAEDLGRQAGGWKRQQQHPTGQNATRRSAPQRAQTLSTAAAFQTGANP